MNDHLVRSSDQNNIPYFVERLKENPNYIPEELGSLDRSLRTDAIIACLFESDRKTDALVSDLNEQILRLTQIIIKVQEGHVISNDEIRNLKLDGQKIHESLKERQNLTIQNNISIPIPNGTQKLESNTWLGGILKHPSWLEFQKFIQYILLIIVFIWLGMQNQAIETIKRQLPIPISKPPVSAPSQTSSGLLNSGAHGDYTGNKTH